MFESPTATASISAPARAVASGPPRVPSLASTSPMRGFGTHSSSGSKTVSGSDDTRASRVAMCTGRKSLRLSAGMSASGEYV